MAALPQMVQSAKGQMFDVNSPQGKMIVNSPNYKPPFSASSSALAPMKPQNSGLSAMGPMQSIQAIFSNMADSLESIKESAISLVAAAEGDARGDALAAANVEGGVNPEVPEFGGEEDDSDGKPSRMPSLKKIGLTLLIAGVMLFAEKIKPVLAKVLEGFKFTYDVLKTSFLAVFDYVKEFFNDPVGTLKKSLDAVLDGLATLGAWIWDKGIKPVWDWLTGLFDSGAGKTIAEAFKKVAGAVTSVGTWIWENAISPVWNWIKGLFGFGDDDKKQEGDDNPEDGGLGTWIWKNAILPVWNWITGLFDNPLTTLLALAKTVIGAYVAIGTWMWEKAILPVWNWITGLFSFGDDDKKQEGEDNPEDGGLGTWIWTNAISPVWNWIKGLFSNPLTTLLAAAKTVLGAYVAVGTWIWDNSIKPIWDWITGLFSKEEGEQGVIQKAFTAYVGAYKKVGTWIWEKAIKPVWDWLTGLFSGDEGEEGVIQKAFTAYVGAYKKVGTWIWDTAIRPVWDWITGLFGFSEDETKKDPDYEEFSIIKTVTDAINGIGTFLKKMFTFDASAFKEKLFDFGTFIKALAFAVPAAMKAVVSQAWTGIGPSEAFEKSFNETMGDGATSGSDITPSGNSSTEELKTVTDQFTRGQGQGTTFIQDFSQTSDVKQQNGDVVIGKDLGADDPDPTLLMMFQNLQRAVF
jgi:hypothetical protein